MVVTRDRRELLSQCLTALQGQQRPADHVLVVDNASSDGTRAMVEDQFPGTELLSMSTNVGGAGGFRAGMEHARSLGAGWMWLLDDDAIARPDCLARLLDFRAPPGLVPAAVLASRIEWTDGRLHPLNKPILRTDDARELVACAERGLAPLRTATFASLLVSSSAVERHGLPIAGYFLWADDIEYTARVLRTERGYFVPTSVAEHRTREPHSPVSSAGDRFYYHVRNNLFMIRGSAWSLREKPGLAWHLAMSIRDYLRAGRLRWRSVRVVLRGVRDGLCRRPRA